MNKYGTTTAQPLATSRSRNVPETTDLSNGYIDTPARIIGVILALQGLNDSMKSMDILATQLSTLAKRSKPWSGKYIHSIYKEHKGYLATSKSLSRHLEILHKLSRGETIRLDGSKETLVPVIIYAHEGSVAPYSTIHAESIYCPQCKSPFVPNVPWRKYCYDCSPKR